MSFTITNTIRKDKKRKDNTYTVYRRVTENRTSKYFATDVVVEQKYWNKKKNEVRGSHDLSTQLSRKLQNEIIRAENIKLDLDINKKLTLENFTKAFRKEQMREDLNFIEVLDSYRKSVKNENYYEWKRLEPVINNLKKFTEK